MVVSHIFLGEKKKKKKKRDNNQFCTLCRNSEDVERIGRVHNHTNQVILHHDKARPHTSVQRQEAIEDLQFTILQFLPYSPDLAPCDFHSFPKLKEQLQGNCYKYAKMFRLL
jgi:hypothetical protein